MLEYEVASGCFQLSQTVHFATTVLNSIITVLATVEHIYDPGHEGD